MLNLGPFKSFLFIFYIGNNENPPITDEISWFLNIRYCGASLYLGGLLIFRGLTVLQCQSITERFNGEMDAAIMKRVPFFVIQLKAVSFVETDGGSSIEGSPQPDVCEAFLSAFRQRCLHQALTETTMLICRRHRHAVQFRVLSGAWQCSGEGARGGWVSRKPWILAINKYGAH